MDHQDFKTTKAYYEEARELHLTGGNRPVA